MSEVSCGGCGAPLSHINAVCDTCLPKFYSTDVPPRSSRHAALDRNTQRLVNVLEDTKRFIVKEAEGGDIRKQDAAASMIAAIDLAIRLSDAEPLPLSPTL